MTHTLTPDWLKAGSTQMLVAAFAKHKVPLRFVGGCVRDTLLGIASQDIDAATPLAPEHVMDLLQTENIKAIPTGIEHGTVTAVIDKKHFEITTLRKDVATDGRHAEVEYTEHWEEDARRRDFTINAFYLSPEGELFDYHHGRADLEKGHVRFIGNPQDRIAEDYLRILRFFRFHARYGKGAPDAAALAACNAAASHIAELSGERIQQEMLKLLSVPHVSPTLSAMNKILPQVLLPAAAENCVRLEQMEKDIVALPHPQLRLAALMALATKTEIAALAARWKLSHAMTGHLEQVVGLAQKIRPDLSLAEQKKLLRLSGAGLYSAAVLTAASQAKDYTAYGALLNLPEHWTPPEFPLVGDDLKLLGFSEGKRLGDALRQLEEQWEASDYTLTKEQLLAKAKIR